MATVTKTENDIVFVQGTTAQRGALSASQKIGMVFYDTTEKSLYIYDTSTSDLVRAVGETKTVSWNDSTKVLTITPFSGSAVGINSRHERRCPPLSESNLGKERMPCSNRL